MPDNQFSAVDGSGENSNNRVPAGVFAHWCYHLRILGWLPELRTPEGFADDLLTGFSGVALNNYNKLLAGAGGFEPPNAGSKDPCLAA